MNKLRFIIGSMILISSSCGVEAPEASEDFKSPSDRRAHLTFTECNVCHEETRPDRDSHTRTGDCVSCHSFPDWSVISLVR
ncbi:hypothetical protein [Pseudobacteriovorax antillogorgiicola]|uniref:Uncharacterized protein n=1 Tax=Pseudobacteriovorax antillogorgiicola TaxID=1513793 RepID=A0A1Y6C142_9BACT|nr:hypothetical protein [Pseudobacteriovorax antillogorgiicola]TCS51267.1 hypothetical protein EDD56_111152 [Pseudobacteriovorax antillogorgiicola]SMF36395.1 hypothetical protein SAMN06296036_11126 [Pseudobacteriovorax antillogorgiicola]